MDTASFDIPPTELAQSLGRAVGPCVLDVRRAPAYAQSGRLLPLAWRVPPDEIEQWASRHTPRTVVVYCVHGHEVSAQAVQQLRDKGWDAYRLQGGINAWLALGLPSLCQCPQWGVGADTPSRWITRARPLIDRVACPWLIRRFVDRQARFFYVPADEVFALAQQHQAVAFDLPGAPLAHVGERCSFDALLAVLNLHSPALERLALIVRGADTAALHRAPESAGLLAVSRGLGLVHADDQALLDAACPLYDALYAQLQAQTGALA